jgi:thermopsin
MSRTRRIEKVALVAIIVLLMVMAVPAGHSIAGKHSSPSVPSAVPIPPVSGLGADAKGNAPYAGYRAMGISDIGSGPNATDYSYHTSSMVGTVDLMNATTDPLGMSFTIQMNVVAVFNVSKTPYAFWVQDVAFANTSNRHITFMDNVWNYSNPYITMNSSSVQGRGTENVYGHQVYYGAGAPYPPAVYPALISLKMVASGYNILVYFGVNGTFTLFDNISFFAHAPLSFFVSNTSAPSGNRYDAELVMGGYGDGASSTFSSMNALLSLSYWNGFNYQAVPSAVNYALNTAESSTNLNVTFATGGNGSLDAHAIVGNETPMYLYSKSTISTLSMVSTVPGNLSIGSSVVPVTWRAILSLYPGTYNVSFTHSGAVVYSKVITFTAGHVMNVSVEPRKYKVSFIESGNLSWSVTIGNQSMLSTSPVIAFLLTNGSYVYHVSVTSNASVNSSVYYPFPYEGTIVVDGNNVTTNISLMIPVAVSLHSNYYPFEVKADGVYMYVDNATPMLLPAGVMHLIFPVVYLPGGVAYFPFNSSTAFYTNYTPSLSSNYTVHVYYQENFRFGLFSNIQNISAVSGKVVITSNASMYIPANSTVHLNVSYMVGQEGFQGWIGEGKGSYSGIDENVTVIMTGSINETALYSHAFVLSILSGGIVYGTWKVILGQRVFSISNGTLTILLPNGTYSMRVVPPSGFAVYPSVFNVTINGSDATQLVSFSLDPAWFEDKAISFFVMQYYSVYMDIGILGALVGLAYALNHRKKK